MHRVGRQVTPCLKHTMLPFDRFLQQLFHIEEQCIFHINVYSSRGVAPFLQSTRNFSKHKNVEHVQGANEELPQQLQQSLSHAIILARPQNYGTAAYDDFAHKLIKALLVRLSTLPNTKKGSVKAFVSDLTQQGEIVIKVQCVALRTESANPETARQVFLLAIHNVYHTLMEKAGLKGDAAQANLSKEMSAAVLL